MKDIEIAGNVKNIELLKVELLDNVTRLYAEIISEGDDGINDRISIAAANIINLTFILSKRLGISFEHVKKSMTDGLSESIEKGHRIEKKYGDLSALRNFIEKGAEQYNEK